jgi:P27 family predicted phage terminase small subunit
MGVLALCDYYTLALYCETWCRWRKAVDFVARHGDSYLVRDAAGRVKGVRIYPQVRLANQLADLLARLGRELGITPASRERAAVIPTEMYGLMDEHLRDQPEEKRRRMLDPSLEGDDDDDGGGGDPGPGEGAAEGEGA